MYLGLLVVGGAAPQVFAHSATTRAFEISDEIEVKDDLDKNPDGCDVTREEIFDLRTKFLWFNDRSVGEYKTFIEKILDAYPEDKFSTIDLIWTAVGDERPFRKTEFSGLLLPDSELTDDLNSEFLFVANGLPGKGVRFSASRNNGESNFRLESHSIQYGDLLVRSLYSRALDYYKCSPSLELGDLIYTNSQVFVENNSLVISTRLARGSLSSLLAKNAK